MRKQINRVAKEAFKTSRITVRLPDPIDKKKPERNGQDHSKPPIERPAPVPAQPTTDLRAGASGANVASLHAALSKLGYVVSARESKEQTYGRSTRDAVARVQSAAGLAVTGAFDALTISALEDRVRAMTGDAYRIEGQLKTADGHGARNVKLVAYRLEVGGEVKLREQPTCDARGIFFLEYRHAGPTPPTVQLRVVNETDEQPLSDWLVQRARRLTIDLTVPDGFEKLEDEHTRLVAALPKNLPDLEENGTRRDISLLAQTTGWDARLIAMASTASALSRKSGISAPAVYGLLRAGLPADAETLARVPGRVIVESLKHAVDTGIVQLSTAQRRAAATAFGEFAATQRLALRAPGMHSDVASLLDVAPVSQQDRAQLKTFFAQHLDDAGAGNAPLGAFWKKVDDDLPQVAGRLKTFARLALLTGNNAPLLSSVLQARKLDLADPASMVDAGFHDESTWAAQLDRLAGNSDEKLARLIPDLYSQGTAKQRRTAYASDLARQVRLAFPMRTLRARVADKTFKLVEKNNDRIQTVLAAAEKDGVAVGANSPRRLSHFLRDKGDTLFRGVDATTRGDIESRILALQCIHQITPSDDSMLALDKLGLRSAHDIVAFDLQTFLERFGKHFPPGEARLVYRKAEEGVATVYNALLNARRLDSSGDVGAVAPPPGRLVDTRNGVKQAVNAAFPSLESLFGSMDFCACEHCRSVLGPPAYFVDLLKFLDLDPDVWTAKVKAWEEANGAYPGKKPYDELCDRRPDLPHLPLTCENTSTELPYIDVVNEILEYYVAHQNRLEPAAVKDTGDVTSADLVAEPQYLDPKAYDLLRDELFPVGAPFDLHLERVRAYFGALEVSWADVLEGSSKSRDLPSVIEAWLERAGFGPHEQKPFTTVAETRWFELYGYPTEADAAELFKGTSAAAKPLARRLGVSYQELLQLVRTRFVNPKLDAFVYLRKAGLTLGELARWAAPPGSPDSFTPAEAADFDAKLVALKKQYKSFDPAKLAADQAAGVFKELVVLADESNTCSFDDTVLRFGEGTADLDAVLYRLSLFVRLYKKLGWSIDETDQLLSTFTFPQEQDLEKLWKARLACAALVDALARTTELGRETVLTFWSDLPTRSSWSPLTPSVSAKPLYDRLFLAAGVLKTDAIFDDALGEYLKGSTEVLADHMPAVQAAVCLSAQELALLVADPKTELLTLPLLSRLYRHSALARGLGISVGQLSIFIELSGLDPFAPLTDMAPQTLDELYPLTRTLELARRVARLGALEGGPSRLDYLCRNTAQATDSLAAALEAHPEALVRDLAERLAKVDRDAAFPAGELTAELLRPKLSLLLPADAVDRFLGAWSGTRVFEAISKASAPLQAADFADDERFSVSPDGKRLRYRGVVAPKLATKLKGLFTTAAQRDLIDELGAQALALAEELPVLLGGLDLDVVFPDLRPLNETARRKALDDRRGALRSKLEPALRDALRRRAVVQAAASSLDADVLVVEPLVTDPALAEDPQVSGATLQAAFESVLERGLTATFFDAGDNVLSSTLLPAAALDAAALPAGAARVRLDGWFDVAATTPLRFAAELAGNATATLEVDGVMLPPSAPGATDWQLDAVVAGPLHRLALDVKPRGGDLAVTVVGDSVPRAPLATALAFWPAAGIERVRRARALLGKLIAVADAWSLGPAELQLLFSDRAPDASVAPLSLPTSVAPTPAEATTAFQRFDLIARYAALRDSLNAEALPMVALFEATSDGDLQKALAEVLPRDASSVAAVMVRLGVSAPVTLEELERLLEGMRLVRQTRLSFDALAGWAENEVDFDAARGVRDAVKARFSETQWRLFARPVHDVLRKKQRDALVAYVLQEKKLDRVEELYEHFLLDPGTEPVVLTSRVQLAIASVQSFVQRCLLNLEPKVPPAVIDAKRWEWMRRYRVWEANRKIFLFPENWLEPEWRRDPSHLYTRMMGSLLQGDVTDEAVEKAFFEYLQGLEELARLEIVSSYHQASAEPSSSVLHVLGRTFGEAHKYFYRRWAHRTWSPWLPVQADIDGDHAAVAIWRDRLHVFWISSLDQPDSPSNGGKTTQQLFNETPVKPPRKVKLQLNWVEYFEGKWVNAKSSGFFEAEQVPDGWDKARLRIHVTHPDALALAVHLSAGSKSEAADTGGQFTFTLRSKNAKVELQRSAPPPPPLPVSFTAGQQTTATGFQGSSQLQVFFTSKTTTDQRGITTTEQGNEIVLGAVGAVRPMGLVPPVNPVTVYGRDFGGLLTPFFLQDEQNTFYVEPNLTETPFEIWEKFFIPLFQTPLERPDIDIRPQRPDGIVPMLDDPRPLGDLQPRVNPVRDWLIRPGVTTRFKDVVIGAPLDLRDRAGTGVVR